MNKSNPILNAATKRRLFRVALTVLDSPELAEDVIQEAYLRFLETEISSEVNSIERPSNWLYTVTRNLAIDRARRMVRERELIQLLPGLELSGYPDEAYAIERRLAELISSLLQVYGSHTVSIILLHVVFGMSYAEIAAICGRSAAACRQIVSRALRSYFSVNNSDDECDETAEAEAEVANIFVEAIFEASMTPLIEKLYEKSTSSSYGIQVGCSSSHEQFLPPETSGMAQVLILKPDGVQWVLVHRSRVLCVFGSATWNKISTPLTI